MTNSTAQAHKETAVKFLQLVVSGSIDEAYEKFVDMDGKHHNPFFSEGFPALQKAMKENDVQFPDKQILIKHILGEGDIVAAHSKVVLNPGDKEIAAVHIFRFKDEKIVEMWDIGQEIPADSPNKDGMF